MLKRTVLIAPQLFLSSLSCIVIVLFCSSDSQLYKQLDSAVRLTFPVLPLRNRCWSISVKVFDLAMPPKTIISKRKRFFQEMQTDTVSPNNHLSEPANSLPHNPIQTAMPSDMITSQRKRFFQELQIDTGSHNDGSSKPINSSAHNSNQTAMRSKTNMTKKKNSFKNCKLIRYHVMLFYSNLQPHRLMITIK